MFVLLLELLDDTSLVDLRFIVHAALRTMEMLHYEQQWEKLVDIALRFNAVTEYVLLGSVP